MVMLIDVFLKEGTIIWKKSSNFTRREMQSEKQSSTT